MRSQCSSGGNNTSMWPVAFIQWRVLRFRGLQNIQRVFFIKSFSGANCISWVFLDRCGHRLPPSTGCKHLQAYCLAASACLRLKTSPWLQFKGKPVLTSKTQCTWKLDSIRLDTDVYGKRFLCLVLGFGLIGNPRLPLEEVGICFGS